jgi:hypothetical protein
MGRCPAVTHNDSVVDTAMVKERNRNGRTRDRAAQHAEKRIYLCICLHA